MEHVEGTGSLSYEWLGFPFMCLSQRLPWLLGARGMLVISNPYSEPVMHSRSVQSSVVCQEPEVTCVTRNWSHRR